MSHLIVAVSFETTCQIAVPEDSVDEVKRLLGRAGFEIALGDRHEGGASERRLLLTIKKYDSAADPARVDRLLTHEVTLRRTLLAAAADFEIIESGSGVITSQHWWHVHVAATGASTGMRVRASTPTSLNAQLDAMARFLGVPRESLTASSDPLDPSSEPGSDD